MRRMLRPAYAHPKMMEVVVLTGAKAALKDGGFEGAAGGHSLGWSFCALGAEQFTVTFTVTFRGVAMTGSPGTGSAAPDVGGVCAKTVVFVGGHHNKTPIRQLRATPSVSSRLFHKIAL